MADMQDNRRGGEDEEQEEEEEIDDSVSQPTTQPALLPSRASNSQPLGI
jgi:hypothetical protein